MNKRRKAKEQWSMSKTVRSKRSETGGRGGGGEQSRSMSKIVQGDQKKEKKKDPEEKGKDQEGKVEKNGKVKNEKQDRMNKLAE